MPGLNDACDDCAAALDTNAHASAESRMRCTVFSLRKKTQPARRLRRAPGTCQREAGGPWERNGGASAARRTRASRHEGKASPWQAGAHARFADTTHAVSAAMTSHKSSGDFGCVSGEWLPEGWAYDPLASTCLIGWTSATCQPASKAAASRSRPTHRVMAGSLHNRARRGGARESAH